jgi:hypothetical protein
MMESIDGIFHTTHNSQQQHTTHNNNTQHIHTNSFHTFSSLKTEKKSVSDEEKKGNKLFTAFSKDKKKKKERKVWIFKFYFFSSSLNMNRRPDINVDVNTCQWSHFNSLSVIHFLRYFY